MPVCLAVAGAFLAALPTEAVGLVWSHSVEKVEWREDWRVQGDNLLLTQAAITGSGPGMEPPADAVLMAGEWRYVPRVPALHRLALANSEYGGEYRLCWSGACRPLADLAPPQPYGPVELYPCAGPHPGSED
jgi:hypothetical protein